MNRYPHVTGVILAGGRATRMSGLDKGTLALSSDPADTPLCRALDLFASRFAGCVIVGRPGGSAPAARDNLPIVHVTDTIPGCGPLGGIHAALGRLSTPQAFVFGCDMPSLCAPLIDLMASRARADRLLVPVLRGRPEPLHAIYPASCLPLVERALQDGIRRLLDLFERAPVDYLGEEEYAAIPGAARSFDNINTPDDLDSVRL